MTSEHTKIQAFLRSHSLEVPESPTLRKAGLVPFLTAPLRYYVMTPVASKPDLGLPDYQLCKGTRMYKCAAGWKDMRGLVPENAELEPLSYTALREGVEELGLAFENIRKLFVLGEYRFTSATNRKDVDLWMLAAEVKNAFDFLPLEKTHGTQHRAWLTLAEFKKQGRPDHAHILEQVEERLRHAYP
jgi:8-oxo-dGTP pyrophosphatase MutT (NUDIX family)